MKENDILTGAAMKRKIVFVIFLALLIAWMSVIFGFSANDAETSTDQSNVVTELLLRIFTPGFEELDAAGQRELIGRYDGLVRKLAHFASYAALAFLMYFTIGSIHDLPFKVFRAAFISLPICVAFAIGDEYHQTFVDGRAGQFKDIVIDSSGSLLGVAVAMAISIVAIKLIGKKQSKRAQ